MSSTNLDAFDLASANLDGVIHEDVMNSIFDVSRIPLPFTDRAGSSRHTNQYFSWRMDKLQDSAIDGQRIDGQDLGATANDTEVGRRVGNQSEIRTKRVEVSTRAQQVNTIGYANELAYQLSRRNQEARRDTESTSMSNNGSVEGTDTVAGVTAGLMAWITNVDVQGNAAATGNANRGALGANGGWDDTATDGLVAPSVAGTARALTETMIRDVAQSVYEQGAESDTLMTTPTVKRLISEYLFTSSARIATMINQQPGGSAEERKAQGSVDLFITDYGSLMLIPNRLQPAFATDNDVVFILDFTYLSQSFLQGYTTKPLARTGLADDRDIEWDWGLRVTNWDAEGCIYDIDPALAMTA